MATKVKEKATSKLNSENVLEELKALAMFGGGVVVGALGGKFIDNALKVDTSIPGFNAKALVRPVALLGAGAAGGGGAVDWLRGAPGVCRSGVGR